MHELGIVMHLIDQVEEIARQNEVSDVTRVVMEVGEVSGVVPDLFEDAFNWAKKKTDFLTTAVLEMIILEGISYCTSCGRSFRTTQHGRECPYCHSGQTYLVTGDQIKIRDLEVT